MVAEGILKLVALVFIAFCLIKVVIFAFLYSQTEYQGEVRGEVVAVEEKPSSTGHIHFYPVVRYAGGDGTETTLSVAIGYASRRSIAVGSHGTYGLWGSGDSVVLRPQSFVFWAIFCALVFIFAPLLTGVCLLVFWRIPSATLVGTMFPLAKRE
ncbi:MAG: hypothetical protein PF961_04245 [Planctomycetota bacterium]|jgi:hypothetical protein|nr:hypothetical protein [Planctomycetota bacterium]